LQKKGQSKKAVLSELKKALQEDQKYENGRILCSMCTKPDSTAKKAHQLFLEANLGDSGLFGGSARLEREVIAELTAILHGEGSAGFVVSGGTEANLLAMLAARNMAGFDEPEVVLPESAHFSFTKICNMLKLKPVYAPLDGDFRVDVSTLERLIGKKTVAVVCSAGTSELGVIDPIEKLSEIALSHDVPLHVDAAFGGLVIPFLKDSKPIFDFSLEAVASITVDPHKMGMAPIPAGGILFRNPQTIEQLKTETPYLTEKAQYTFLGTRSGASVAATWAVFKHLGMEGFRRTVQGCMDTTMLLRDGIVNLGLSLVIEPALNILAFRSENTKLLAEKLNQNGWFVSYVPRLDCIRIVVMPHVKQQHAEDFLETLGDCRKSFNA
jgi:tyrosine decarboxylase/aspartate 1-decarboxylase